MTDVLAATGSRDWARIYLCEACVIGIRSNSTSAIKCVSCGGKTKRSNENAVFTLTQMRAAENNRQRERDYRDQCVIIVAQIDKYKRASHDAEGRMHERR